MDKVNVTLRLGKETVALLDQLAQSDERDRTFLIKKAIDGYLQMRQWQIEETKKALAEADAGDFASDEDVARMFDELTR
jgi:predicted transcriptional regulator